MLKFSILTFFILVLHFAATPMLAQLPDTSFNPIIGGTQGRAFEFVQRADGKFIVTGDFQVIGGVRRNLIALVNADGTVDPSFDVGDPTSTVPQSTVLINQVSPLSDGKLIVNGTFTHINGIQRKGPLRLNLDGAVDPSFSVGTGANSTIYAIKALPTGKILIAGSFTTFNNQPTPPLIRLNSDGSLDQSFSPNIVSFGGIGDILIQPDNKIVAIGDISSPQTGQFQGIARYNEDGSIDNSFNPGTGASQLSHLAIQPDGKILISGGFSNYNGTARSGKARINSDGSLDTSFNFSFTGSVPIIQVKFFVQNDGKILITGPFDTINGASNRRIARLNSDGSLDSSFSTIIDQNDFSTNSVNSLFILPDGSILATGSFYFLNGLFRFGVGKLDNTGATIAAFRLDVRSIGTVLNTHPQSDGKTLVVGSFSQVNNSFQYGLARLNLDGTVDPTFSTGRGVFDQTTTSLGHLIYSVAIQNDGKILVGGSFRTFNDILRPNLARLNPDGSVDTSFPNVAPIEIVRHIIVQPDGKILLFGEIRRLNPDGTSDTTFNPGTGPNGVVVYGLLQPDGKIIICGSFSSFNGTSRVGIARLNPNGSLDTSFTTSVGTNTGVSSAILQSDGKVLIAGSFTSVNGVPRNRIARLNPDGSLDNSFDPGTGADNQINSLILQPNGKVIVTGTFNNFSGLPLKKLVQINSNGTPDASFGTTLDWYSTAVSGVSLGKSVVFNGGLFVSGNYSKLNDRKLTGFSKLILPSPSKFDFDGDSKTDLSIFRPSNGQWWLNRSTQGVIAHTFGNSTDKLTPADFTGDGRTDVAIFRPSSGEWFVLRSENSTFYSFPFGISTDIPVPNDYDGDGKADAAVFRPSDSTWYVQKSSGGAIIETFGASGDFPVSADYDGDGKADLAIYRASLGQWWLKRSTAGLVVFTFGTATDKTVPGDYTGDGKADVAFWRPTTGEWFILRSENASFYSFPFGASGDLPVPGDYDGDGKLDAGVFRPANANWYLNRSTAGVLIQNFGLSTDFPVPSAFTP